MDFAEQKECQTLEYWQGLRTKSFHYIAVFDILEQIKTMVVLIGILANHSTQQVKPD